MVLTPKQKKNLNPRYKNLFPEGEPDQAWNDEYTDMFFKEYLHADASNDSNTIIDFYIHCLEVSILRLNKQPPAHPWDEDPFSSYCIDSQLLFKIQHSDIIYLAANIFYQRFQPEGFNSKLLSSILEIFQLMKEHKYRGYNEIEKARIKKAFKTMHNKYIYEEYFGS